MSFQDMLDTQQKFAQVKRLRDKLFRPDLKSFQTMFGGAQSRHEHDWDRGLLLDVASQLETRTVGKADIQNDQIPIAFLQLSERALPGFNPRDVILFAQQPLVQSGAKRTIIFDQQQALHNWYARFLGALRYSRLRRAYPQAVQA